MRKIFFILVLLALWLSLAGFTLPSGRSAADIAAEVVETSAGTPTYETSVARLFPTEEHYGEDIYQFIYRRTKYEGSDKAVARLLSSKSYSKEELLILLPGKYISQFFQEKNLIGTGVRGELPEEVQKRYEVLQQELADEKEFADLESGLETLVEPTEIFSNGDEGDSGFDLLADLDIIDAIIFGKPEAERQQPPESQSIGSGEDAFPPVNVGNPFGESRPRSGSGVISERFIAALDIGNLLRGERADAAFGAPSSNPSGHVTCPVNAPFHEAAEQIRAQEFAASGAPRRDVGSGLGAGSSGSVGARGERDGGRTPGEEGDLSGGGSGYDGIGEMRGQDVSRGQSGGREDESRGDSEDGGEALEENIEGPAESAGEQAGGGGTSEEGPVMPELPANWKRPLPCNKIFCVKVETLFKKQSARVDSENCITCHFEKINDAFKKTIDRNLTPSKATGNLMEGPKCKRQAIVGAAFNIITIPQPILTPPNDDLVTKQEFSKSFFNLLESYWGVPGGCDSARAAMKGVGERERNIAVGGLRAAGACESPPDAAKSAAKSASNHAADNEEPERLLSQIQNSVTAKRQEAAELMEKKRRESVAEAHASQYRALMAELDAFNAYFNGFLALFREIVSEEGESPCVTLKTLPQCK